VFRNDVFYVETSNLSYFDNTGDMIVRSYKIRARDNSSNYSGFGNVVSKRWFWWCKLNFANNK
jgi:hypothetical protein